MYIISQLSYSITCTYKYFMVTFSWFLLENCMYYVIHVHVIYKLTIYPTATLLLDTLSNCWNANSNAFA